MRILRCHRLPVGCKAQIGVGEGLLLTRSLGEARECEQENGGSESEHHGSFHECARRVRLPQSNGSSTSPLNRIPCCKLLFSDQMATKSASELRTTLPARYYTD